MILNLLRSIINYKKILSLNKRIKIIYELCGQIIMNSVFCIVKKPIIIVNMLLLVKHSDANI